MIGGIFLGTIFSWDLYGVQDNRILAKKPDVTSLKLVQIPVQFEAYLNDHFGEIESLWVRVEYDVLKKASESYHPDVVIDEVQERFLY